MAKKHREHHISKNKREFHPILVIDVFEFIDVLVSFGCQNLKDQGHSGQ